MRAYLFVRIINKKGAINQYGKQGFRLHREGVMLKAESTEEALKLIEPYNYKKHIKFALAKDLPACEDYMYDTIVDMGVV